MTNKKKYDLIMKLNRLKQTVIIILMILSGIWYVTKGKSNTAKDISQLTYQTVSDDKVPDKALTIDAENNVTAHTDASDKSQTADNYETTGKPEPSAVPNNETTAEEKENTLNHQDSSLINLNTATLEELDTLPGVGPSTAQNIINYRNEYGGFAEIEELKNVKRIGDKTFAKLKDHITV